jgi:hypothetical protein
MTEDSLTKALVSAYDAGRKVGAEDMREKASTKAANWLGSMRTLSEEIRSLTLEE